MMAGATPKVIISDKESNSFPNGLTAFNLRAAMPSRLSKIAPIRTNIMAKNKYPLNASNIEEMPETKFPIVIKEGMTDLFNVFASFK